MNTVTSVIADALDDAQLTITYRRIMRKWGEEVSGLLFNDVKHGALVFEIVDRSGWALPEGTFFEGTVAAGFFRSVLTWGSGFIEDSLTMVGTTDELYPDEYYQTIVDVDPGRSARCCGPRQPLRRPEIGGHAQPANSGVCRGRWR